MQASVTQRAKQTGLEAFLLYASLPVGGVAFCFLLGTYVLLQLPLSWPLLVLGFCATFLIYQAERALQTAPEDRFNHLARMAWLAQHQRYLWLSSIGAMVVAMAMVPFLRLEVILVGGVLGVLSVLYMMPLGKRGRRLKSYAAAKPLLISLAWSIGGVVLPVLQAGRGVGGVVLVLLMYRFFFVLPNALLSDWPDREGDRRAGLQTLATRFSLRHLQWFATASLVLGIGGVGVALFYFSAPWVLCIDVVGLGGMLWLIWRPVPFSRFRFSFLLDAMVAWPGVTACIAFWIGL